MKNWLIKKLVHIMSWESRNIMLSELLRVNADFSKIRTKKYLENFLKTLDN